MKAKYALIALLAITFWGCDDNTAGLGLGMFPGSDQNINGKLSTFDVTTESVHAGKIYAMTNVGYVGKFTDETFGTYQAGFLAELNCPSGMTFPGVYNGTALNDKKKATNIMVDEAGLGDDAIGIYNTDNINDPKRKLIGNIHTIELYLWYSSYFGDSLTACRLSVYALNENLDTITTFGKIPVEYTGSNITTFTGDLLVDGNTVYYASNNFTYMAAYEISNRKPIVKFEKMFVPPVLLNSGDRISFNKNKHLDGFLALKSYKDYLFATYSGKPKAELDLNGSSALVPTTILAFDKSGNPLAKFTTPYKIRSIAFTDEKMYLLDLDCNIESINMDEVLKYL